MTVPSEVITLADPAAGADFTTNVPLGQAWYVDAVTYRLVATAVAGNRLVSLRAENSVPNVWFISQAPTQTAPSQTVRACAFAGAPASGIAGVAFTYGLPVGGLFLPPLTRLYSLTAGLDVGDQISQIVLMIRRTSVLGWA